MDIKNSVFSKLNELFDLDELTKEQIVFLEKHIDQIISNANKLKKIQDAVINNEEKFKKFTEKLDKAIGKI